MDNVSMSCHPCFVLWIGCAMLFTKNTVPLAYYYKKPTINIVEQTKKWYVSS